MASSLNHKIYRIRNRIVTTTRSLKQRKLRSILSIVGVVCGVMAVLTMVSIGEGAKQETLRKIERLGIKNIYIRPLSFTKEEKQRAEEQLSQGLSLADAHRLQALGKTVADVAVFDEVQASLMGSVLHFTPQVAACSANYFSLYQLRLRQGRFFSYLDSERHNPVCIIGAAVAAQLQQQGWLGGQIRVGGTVLRVVGVLHQEGGEEEQGEVLSLRNYDEMILVPIGLGGYLQNGPGQESGTELSEIIVKVKKDVSVDHGVAETVNIMTMLHNGVDDYDVIVPEELLQQSNETRRIFNIVLGTIAGISLLVGGIGIMNIMLATVTERTREIGIRRAVGARRSDITGQFLLEALLLTTVGGVLGVVLGVFASISVSLFANWPTAITPYAVMLPLILSCLTGLFFGWYPASKAAAMHPISALRHE